MSVILNDNAVSITEDLSNLTNREIDLALARTIGYHPVQLDKNLYHSALDQSKNYFILCLPPHDPKCFLFDQLMSTFGPDPENKVELIKNDSSPNLLGYTAGDVSKDFLHKFEYLLSEY